METKLPECVEDIVDQNKGQLVYAVPDKVESDAWLLIFEYDQTRSYQRLHNDFVEPVTIPADAAKEWVSKQAPEKVGQLFEAPIDETNIHVDAPCTSAARAATDQTQEKPTSTETDLPVYEPHPLCKKVPCLGPSDFEALKNSIESTGGIGDEKIVLFEEQILDGRHRYKACTEADIELAEDDFEEFEGGSGEALAYVQRKVTHRHLTTPEKAALAVELYLPQERTEAEQRQKAGKGLRQDSDTGTGRATERAGRRVGVSRDSVLRVEQLKEGASHVYEDIMAGRYSSIAEAERAAERNLVVYEAARDEWLGQGVHQKSWDDAFAKVDPEPDDIEDDAVAAADKSEDGEDEVPATEEHSSVAGDAEGEEPDAEAPSGGPSNPVERDRGTQATETSTETSDAREPQSSITSDKEAETNDTATSETSIIASNQLDEVQAAFSVVAGELESKRDLPPYNDIEPEQLDIVQDVLGQILTTWSHRDGTDDKKGINGEGGE